MASWLGFFPSKIRNTVAGSRFRYRYDSSQKQQVPVRGGYVLYWYRYRGYLATYPGTRYVRIARRAPQPHLGWAPVLPYPVRDTILYISYVPVDTSAGSNDVV